MLVAYHGLTPQFATFRDVLATLSAFLVSAEGKTETVVVSIKQEDWARTPEQLFARLVWEEIAASGDEQEGAPGFDWWFVEDRIPSLGAVRGKAILFSRFEAADAWPGPAIGIHPTRWPDSRKEGFEWTCEETLVKTHDWCARSAA